MPSKKNNPRMTASPPFNRQQHCSSSNLGTFSLTDGYGTHPPGQKPHHPNNQYLYPSIDGYGSYRSNQQPCSSSTQGMYGSVDEYGASRREPVDRNPSYALDTYIKALKPEEVPLDESLFAHGPRDRIESAHRVTQDRRTTENLTGYNRRPASYPYDTNLDMDEPVVDDPQAARHFAKDRYAIEQNQSTYYVGGGTPFYQPLNEGYQVPRQGSEPRQMNIDSIYATEQGQQYQHYSRFSSSS